MTTAGLRLGAPGIVLAPELPDRSLRPVRLDVAGFAGVAPRGPVDTPTLVRSWSDYRLRFGAFEGPGRLPYAVSVFFEQGGERAYIVRVGRGGGEPEPAADTARARFTLALPGAAEPVHFVAANPGRWGSALTVRLEFDATPRFPIDVVGDDRHDVLLPVGLTVPPWSLLRLAGGFRWVTRVERRQVVPGRLDRIAVLDRPLPDTAGLVADLVTATLVVDDGDRAFPRTERLPGLGLAPDHPTPLARAASALITPVGSWTDLRLAPDPLLTPVQAVRADEGHDIDATIDSTSFFDTRTPGPEDAPPPDPRVASESGEPARLRGATGLARIDEIGLLAVPDLFWDWVDDAPPPDQDVRPGSAVFEPCRGVAEPVTYLPRPRAVLLDGATPDGLRTITDRQQPLVALAERYRRFVALLDVPQRLDTRGIARWRAGIDSSFAAAYHPWLSVLRTDSLAPGRRGQREQVPPSAFAAGIIAARERRLGLPWGPANELAAGAVTAVAVTSAEHDALHPLGINVFRAERDGFRLTAARTLARDQTLRQLNVRRLLTMLRLALEREMQWVVFEPATVGLRELLRHTLLSFLRELYRAGAFAGDSEEQAFFVRTDDDLNPPASVALGRLTVEVGVAPAEPIEFIVLRITRDGDGGVRVEEGSPNG